MAEKGKRIPIMTTSYFPDLDEECRKADLERVFMKYGPLKEIWLASYAPFYAFVVYRNRLDAQVPIANIS